MPNTSHGGGISRKISSAADRKRLKAIMAELNLPPDNGLHRPHRRACSGPRPRSSATSTISPGSKRRSRRAKSRTLAAALAHRKIGPALRGDPQLGIGDLPEQEIADPHFARRADEQIGVGHAAPCRGVGRSSSSSMASGFSFLPRPLSAIDRTASTISVRPP